MEQLATTRREGGPAALLLALNWDMYGLPRYDSNPMHIWPGLDDIRHSRHACIRRSFVMGAEIEEMP